MKKSMLDSMVCYVGIAVITNFLAQLEHLNSDEVPGWTWVGWARFVGYLVLAAFTTYKAYVPRPPEEPPPIRTFDIAAMEHPAKEGPR